MIELTGKVEVVTLDGVDEQFYYEACRTKKDFLTCLGLIYEHVKNNQSVVTIKIKAGKDG